MIPECGPRAARDPVAEAMPQATPAPIATPCVRICTLEPMSGICLGCGRTMREIGSWPSLSPENRAAIMASLGARLDRLRAAQPGLFLDGPPDDDDAR